MLLFSGFWYSCTYLLIKSVTHVPYSKVNTNSSQSDKTFRVPVLLGYIEYNSNSHGALSLGSFSPNHILLRRQFAYTRTYDTCEYFPPGMIGNVFRDLISWSRSPSSSGVWRIGEEKWRRKEGRWMSMVFHGVSGCAECDGNKRGKRRRGGDPAFWWFNLRRGCFCVIIFSKNVWRMTEESGMPRSDRDRYLRKAYIYIFSE